MIATLTIAGCGGSSDSGSTPDSGGTDTAPSGEPTGEPAPAPTADAAPRGPSSVTGSVKFKGDPPKAPTLDMAADPGCAAKHSGPVYNEGLVLGDGNTMANVLVKVTGGLPAGSHTAPSEPAVMDQNGCRYNPHVFGLQVGQTLRILNSDSLLHNVHSLSKVNSPFNRAMPGAVKKAEFTFTREEGMFKIKCDVHPWMSAFVGVMTHPYFAVTGPDGTFEIAGLPAGTYEIEAWHEILGTQSGSVTVGDGESASVDFSFSR